ncbi:MAG: caspase family protein [Acidobacteriota bacterium]
MSENNTGQGENQGSKTGMGIEAPIGQPMNAYALLIGVGSCKYSEWSLPVTSLDARELGKVLADPGLCGYPKERIKIVSDEAATREGILAAVDELTDAAKADPEATFFIYYSGHGWRHAEDDEERYYLIPHDVRPFELTESALPAQHFIDALRRLRAQRVLVMVDTCHAAAMADAKNLAEAAIPREFAQEPLPKALFRELESGKGRVVCLSCDEAQKSWILPGEGSLSIFTHHLLEALRGVGSNPQDTSVTVSGLMKHLGREIPASARKIGRQQTPFFRLAAQDFPVALVRGGKGLPAQQDQPTDQPASSTRSVSVGTANAGKNVIVADTIGTVQ